MELIAHRINTVEELKNTSSEYGIEVDVRDNTDGSLYISHNPFELGEDFKAYLDEYHHGTMIINVKSERIELKIMELLKEYGIADYFFLDSTFPMIYLLSQIGEENVALRLSEYEGIDTIRNMAGKAEWVWIDCFNKIPVTKEELDELKALGYRTCLVSPELQGKQEELEKYIREIKDKGLYFDAVCTKSYNISKWKSK